MKLSSFVSACLIVLASASLSKAEISQHFDRTGRLVSSEKRPPLPQSQKMKRYSVPEGIELRPDVHYDFYPVFGKTFAEIVRSAEENGPRNERTRKRQASAYTWSLEWTYDFSYSLEPDEESEKVHCDIAITEPVLSYDITVTLPALTDDSALNPIEKDLWKNFVATLLERMQGRIKIIKNDSKDDILKEFGEIAYIALSEEEAANAEKLLDRHIRTETAAIGSSIIRQIQKKLEAFDSVPEQDGDTRPAKSPSRRRIIRQQ